ncbi:xyloside xylosyltransferase 1-like [Penaeus monodon]|uniref:xyloside xylosyltransferase 1-like n=1 Tax=Penaeus monodon TaxID=6687 RepID=UPI0018A71D90|nr:xyloside xylosyltransferase 1-like [Penaeus monodon]
MLLRLRLLGQAAFLVVVAASLILLFAGREPRASPGDTSPVAQRPRPSQQARGRGPGLKQEGEGDEGQNEEEEEEEANLPPQEAVPLSSQENDLLYRPPLDIALIFTHAKDNAPFQYKLRVAVGSLLQAASAPLRLHLITDADGFHIASQVITEVQAGSQLDSRYVKLVYVAAEDFIPEIESSVTVLQDFFTTRRDAYYRDALFFFSLFLHRLLPGLERIMLMDIDIKVKGDIAELYSHFERFSPTNVMGMSLEQSPVYLHLLSLYRRSNPKTTLGSPPGQGGFPGYNSGIVLVDIERLRNSKIISRYLSRSTLTEKTKQYSFQGHLGDQDLYTLIAFDHPELFYTLPCGWNRQLCEWWRGHGYQTVFDQYFNCTGELKIIHGNCKTEIPENL